MKDQFFIEEGLKDYHIETTSSSIVNRARVLWDKVEPESHSGKRRFWVDWRFRKFFDVPLLEEYSVGDVELAEDEFDKLVEFIREALKENNRLQDLQARCRRIGIHYWPVIFGPKIDLRAYKIAEDILAETWGYWEQGTDNRGGWDSYGHYGLSPYDVARMWFASGCKDGPKFRAQVKYGMVANDQESVAKFIHRAKGYLWLNANMMINKFDWSNRVQRFLGRVSAPIRWAAVDGLGDEYRFVRYKDLNWTAIREVHTAKRTYQKVSYCPIRLKWQLLHNLSDAPHGLGDIDPTQKGVKLKLYKQLCSMVGVNAFEGPDDNVGLRKPCWMIASVFDNIHEVKRVLKKRGTPHVSVVNIHDLGQFPLPSSTDKGWKDLALKYGTEVLEHAGRWAPIERINKGVPRTLVELRRLSAFIRYDGVRNEAVAEAAALCNLGQGDFEEYQLWYEGLSPKTSEGIPHVSMTLGSYRIVQLEHNDPIAPLMGLLSNCCQHPRGAANSCARASIEDPNCAIWVVYDRKNNVVCQTFVWRSEDTLVMDSVEAKDHDCAERVADILYEAANSVIGRLCIRKVNIGETSYGITGRLARIWNAKEVSKPPRPIVGYSDANVQKRVV